MARRKRLTPAQMTQSETDALPEGLEVKSALPPIAQVASQSATEAAFQEVATEMRRAREEGRLIQLIPLDAIVEDHLVRDRLAVDDEDMAALVASIQARGQTTPIEVVETAPGKYGLISGWRRLQALRRLRGSAAEDDGRFIKVRALVIKPRDAGDSYVAMVEENEIRADLSHYERARIVARSVQAGAFADTQTALRTLFANASRAKRSKIKSFMTLVDTLDDVLRFPTHLGERLGLELAGRLNAEPSFGQSLSTRLQADAPTSPEAEAEILRAALNPPAKAPKNVGTEASSQDIPADIFMDCGSQPGVIVLSGPGVDEAFQKALEKWLKKR